MPTRNRRPFVPLAIDYFLRQDYPLKELVIVDDGTDSVEDLVPPLPSVRYHRVVRRTRVGAARNLACEMASGSVIAHWDDDDWQAPDRLSRQLRQLESGRVDLCGMTSLLYYAPGDGRAWRFDWPPRLPRWLAGQSLCFRRDLWVRSPFPDLPNAEDAVFVRRLADRPIAVTPGDSLVALVHPGNTVAKTSLGVHCTPSSMTEVRALLGPDLDLYRSLPPEPRRSTVRAALR
ncbi:glycosyltransferase family 2 protein [Streptomyces sp. NPDC002588]|uniref:glycosyltransferase family 2 protein n=1 Tax=Streptomyces sp. NPDC002588 TaxID=3154419 RepID=UPI00331A2E79